MRDRDQLAFRQFVPRLSILGLLLLGLFGLLSACLSESAVPVRPVAELVEIERLRSETSKTYQRWDGRLVSVFHAKPIHYRVGGQWVDIAPRWTDSELEAYVLVLEGAPYRVWLAGRLRARPFLRVQVGARVREYTLGPVERVVWTGSTPGAEREVVRELPDLDLAGGGVVSGRTVRLAIDAQMALEFVADNHRLMLRVDAPAYTSWDSWLEVRLVPLDVQAATTSTFYGETSDGQINGDASVYSTARSTSSTCSDTGTTLRVGQWKYTGPRYGVWRDYIEFDTSSIPDGDTISSAELWLYGTLDQSVTDFDVEIYQHNWSEALCSSREANYDGAYAGSKDTTFINTSSWSTTGYMTASVSTGYISKTGETEYSVVSSRDVAGTQPSGNEYVDFASADEAGTTKDPKLVVVHYTPATPTPTSTPTPTNTPTPSPTPTVTPVCPVVISSDTTWGPGTVRVNCHTGVTTGVTLTIAAGTTVYMVGDRKLDVKGTLYAVGTVTNPITLTQETAPSLGSWGCVYLQGEPSTLHYVNVYYGSGVNDAAGSDIRYSKLMTNTYGLALLGPKHTTVMSSTVQWNNYGLLMYMGASPWISYTNILSNTLYDAEMHQAESVTTLDCWWGSDPPDDDKVWDYGDDFRLGLLDRTAYATGWVSW